MSGKSERYPNHRIRSLSSRKIVTNEEIRSRLKFPEMHPAEKAVIGNIGVNERRRANESETPMFMASKVAEMALKDAGKKPDEVDLYILANWTDRYYLPDLAPQASKLSGTKNALAFDVSTCLHWFCPRSSNRLRLFRIR